MSFIPGYKPASLPPASEMPQHLRYECTCGWSLDYVADVDGDRSHVKCCECGGIAVRRVVEVRP